MSEVTLALLLSIIAVISAVAPPVIDYFANHSETYFQIAGTDTYTPPGKTEAEPTIRLLVMNSGKRASYVRAVRIQFDRTRSKHIDAVNTNLVVQNIESAFVPPNNKTTMHVSVASVPRFHGKTKDEVLKQIPAGGWITITVKVQETDIHGNPFYTYRQDRIAADRLYYWLELRVSSN